MNILTFDIEDWFHTHQNRKYFSGHVWKELPSRIVENTDRILAMLEELDLKATFFILGWVAEYHPKLVKRIYNKGHEIAAHSYWHHNANLLSPADFEKDLVMCLKRLHDLTGKQVTTYRAPGFSLRLKDQWTFDILSGNGISVDSSVQLRSQPQSLPIIIESGDVHILEFPLIRSAFGIPYSGGGFFRAMPRKLLSHFFMDTISDDREEQYRLLYFHPRDFDSEYPYSNLFSLYRNGMNKFNTDICMVRLKQILIQQPSCTLGQAVDQYSNNTKNL